MPSYNHLSHTFRAFHDKCLKEKDSQAHHLFDLQNTFDLSIQMIESILSSTNNKQEDKNKIKKAIKKIKESNQKKKQLNKDKVRLRSKILVDHQVCEESKRRIEENANYYQDQNEGIAENIEKKVTFIKKFYKKFNEVEIYIQRECASSFKFRSIFYEFEINPFLYTNEKYLREKNEYYKIIKGLNHDIKIIVKENIELKKREELISEENETESDKYAELIRSYTCKIHFFQTNNYHLKLCLRNLMSQIKMKSIQKNLLDAYQDFEDNTIKNGEDKNNNGYDKYDSILLNTNPLKGNFDDGWNNNIHHDDNTQNKTHKNSAIGWDISCIEKTDDN